MARLQRLAMRGALLVIAASMHVLGQGVDLVYTENLGTRGVAFEGPPAFSGFFDSSGNTCQGIGDFNGDGYDDIALTVRERQDSPNINTLVLVMGRRGLLGANLVGREGNLPDTAIFLPPQSSSGGFLRTGGPGGDFNGDGRADLLFSDEEAHARGAGFLVYGSEALDEVNYLEDVGDLVPGIVFISTDPSDGAIGASMTGVGDFNGDGEVDLAIGAPVSSPLDRVDAGVVYLLFKTKDLPSVVDLSEVGKTIPGVRILGRFLPHDPRAWLPEVIALDPPIVGDWLGNGLAPAGDFNGDGLDDLLVMTETKVIFLILGRPAPPAILDLQELSAGGVEGVILLSGPQPNVAFGKREQAVGVGDLNGDGFDDILVGVGRIGTSGESLVYLLPGRPDFPAFVDFNAVPEGLGTRIHGLRNEFFGDYFGGSVAPAGDLNLDGIPDLLLGASRASVGGKTSVGEAYAVFGRREFGSDLYLAKGFEGMHLVGQGASSMFGSDLSPAGDFNGDGLPDLLVMASHLGAGDQALGQTRSYVIYGSGSGPPPLTLLEVVPSSGSIRGGTTVILRGSGFKDGAEVRFGGRSSPVAAVLSGSAIRAVTPSGDDLGPTDVGVRVGGESAELRAGFEYTPDFPQIDLQSLGTGGLILEGEKGRDLGNAVALGDITGDGTADLIVGSLGEGTWSVFIFPGQPGLPDTIRVFEPSAARSVIQGGGAATPDAFNVAILGDHNGDGIRDLGIGLGLGQAYVLFGRAGLEERIDLSQEMDQGRAVRLHEDLEVGGGALVLASVGDLTNDGTDDLAVGFGAAPKTKADPISNAGEILLVRGQKVWPSSVELGSSELVFLRIHGESEDQRFGSSVVSVGDINGDGLQDLLTTNGSIKPDGYLAYLLYGGATSQPESSVSGYLGEVGGVVLNRCCVAFVGPFLHLAGAGDVNADGFPDILLGDELAGESNEGMTFLVYGGPSLPQEILLSEDLNPPDGLVRVFGGSHYVQSGRVGPAGDFNGDGFSDFLVGAQGPGPLLPGNVSVILGGPHLPPKIDLRRLGGNGIKIEGRIPLTSLQTPAAEAGDLNGDGSPDFVFSEAYRGGSSAAIYAIYGRSSTFVRGDANRDGRADLSDAVFILSHLFLANQHPPCEDALDVTDDGVLDISDAIYLLGYLFLGRPAPPAPYPRAGADMTRDSLRCGAF